MGLISKMTGRKPQDRWAAEVQRYRRDLEAAIDAADLPGIDEVMVRGVALMTERHGLRHEATLRVRFGLASQRLHRELPAAPVLVRALRADCEAALGPLHAQTLLVRLLGAQALRHADHIAEADREYLAVAEEASAAYGPGALTARLARAARTTVLISAGRYAEGVAAADAALAETGPLAPEATAVQEACLANRAQALHRLGENERALADLAELDQVDENRRRSKYLVSPAGLASRGALRALIELDLGRPAEAERTARAAVDTLAAIHGLDPAHTASLWARTVHTRCLLALGLPDEARDPAVETARLAAERHGAQHSATLEARFVLAECLRALGQEAEALALHTEVLAVRRPLLGPDHDDTQASEHACGPAGQRGSASSSQSNAR